MDSSTLLLGVAILISLIGLVGSTIERKINRLNTRMAWIEHRLDRIATHVGVGPDPALDQVRALLAEGREVEAVKAYRASTGTNLKEAAIAVRQMKH